MLYSKNGSIPKPETDGTEGWIEVPDQPDCPKGKEVIWWYPPGWVIRDPKPAGNWSWSQSEERWVEIVHVTEQIQSLTTDQIVAMETSQISGLNG
jgi:hypothetical protein